MSMWLDGPVFTRSRTRYDRVVRCRDAAAEAAEYWAECLDIERRLQARRRRKARLAAGVFLMVSPRRAQNARAEAAAARCARAFATPRKRTALECYWKRRGFTPTPPSGSSSSSLERPYYQGMPSPEIVCSTLEELEWAILRLEEKRLP
jgi:hypothetical protein